MTDVKVELMIYLGILLTQIGAQFIKNIFEESVWGAYLTNQLIKYLVDVASALHYEVSV